MEIQFSSHGRAAFRINACAVPKDGIMTLGGQRTAEELEAGGLHDHFETHGRPWLRPALRALGLEPLGGWFSVWHGHVDLRPGTTMRNSLCMQRFFYQKKLSWP